MLDRIDELKAMLAQKRHAGSAEPPPFHWYYLEGFVAALDDPFEIREAKARLHFYQHVPITIQPGEFIVGQVDWNEPLVCFVSNTRIREEVLDRIQSSELAEAEKRKIAEWVEAVRPFCFDPWPHLTEEERLVQESHLAPSTFFNGHIVPAYGYVLQRGLGGVLEDIQRYRDRRLTDVERNFYDAMQITVEGLSAYITRYADLAGELLEQSAPGYRSIAARAHPVRLPQAGLAARRDFPRGAADDLVPDVFRGLRQLRASRPVPAAVL